MKIKYTRFRNIREIVTYEVEIPDNNVRLVQQVGEAGELLGDYPPDDLDQYVCDHGAVVHEELGDCDEDELTAIVEVIA